VALILLDPIRPYKVIAYGTAFRLVPGKDASGTFWRYGFEVQRAPDSGGSPGTPIDIFSTDRPLPTSGGVFVDQLPPAATYYHYRWRHVGPGFAAGAYSSYIKRAADQLPQSVLDAAVNNENIYPIDRGQALTDGEYAVKTTDSIGKPLRSQVYTDGEYAVKSTDNTGKPLRAQAYVDGGFAVRSADTAGKEAFDDLFVLATKTVKVGTVASPSSIAKTIRIPALEFIPGLNTTTWDTRNGDLRPNTVNVNQDFEAPCVLPKGVTITAFRLRGYRQTVSDTVATTLTRIDDTGGTTGLATNTHDTTGWQTKTTSGLTQLVGDESYIVVAALKGVSSFNDARLLYLEVDYTVPSYDKGY
jgi:hypothetical protein